MLKIVLKYLKHKWILLVVTILILALIRLGTIKNEMSDPPGVTPVKDRNIFQGEVTPFLFRNGNTKVRKFAYGFYAVTEAHVVAALVNIKRLKEKRKLNSIQNEHVDFVILTNLEILQRNTKLFEDVKLITYQQLPTTGGFYRECMVKLIFFGMTDYYRIIYMDIDALVMKPLDELFFLPSSVSLASPVAYWENELCFTSALLVIKPNHKTWLELFNRMDKMVKNNKADMDVVNVIYEQRPAVLFKIYPEVLLLPGYFLVLSCHFRDKDQSYYRDAEPIFKDIDNLAERAYIVHFSQQPKPWYLSRIFLNILSYWSISKYFFDFNMEFIDEYNAIQDLLKANQSMH